MKNKGFCDHLSWFRVNREHPCCSVPFLATVSVITVCGNASRFL